MKVYLVFISLVITACLPEQAPTHMASIEKQPPNSVAMQTLSIDPNFSFATQTEVEIALKRLPESQVARLQLHAIEPVPQLVASWFLAGGEQVLSASIAQHHPIINLRWFDAQGEQLGERTITVTDDTIEICI